MSNNENMQTRLGTCRNTGEVRQVVNEVCAEFGQIINMTLLCGKQNPGQTLCVVDFLQGVSQPGLCASTLGGRVFGFNSVVFSFAPNSELGCVRGFPPGSPSCSCTPHA